ncbi:hypothetical protein LTR08_008452 [Meristemomyces frigidus]|nr:hypothetical protein LTR08_008452 [Meristemomyces frigidus]
MSSVRLQALRDNPESFTETHDEAAARNTSHWQDFLQQTPGLLQVALGISESARRVDDGETADDWALKHGVPLGMSIHAGPLPPHRFLCPPGSSITLNRPDAEELRFFANMLYIVPSVRGKAARGQLLEAMTLDRDLWLLDQLRGVGADPPPVARCRGTVVSGPNESELLNFYTTAGWNIVGKLTWAQSRLAEGGEEAVEIAKARGHDMGKLSIAIERVWTVPHLEWRVVKNRQLMGQWNERQRAKL